jgi:transcription-repair coupling factor (superfamily II helicase)
LAVKAESELFARALKSPAVQSLARRLEKGGVLSCRGVSEGAQPFTAALIHLLFPTRPIVVVTEGLKTQESYHQDLTTWLQVASGLLSGAGKQTSQSNAKKPLFYPAWEILPHEDRLPHADVISERLETLVALATASSPRPSPPGEKREPTGQIVVTSVAALMQRTFAAGVIERRTKAIATGDRIDPLDLVEWLEEQGYEPEAQVTQKGEMALRGGIVDLFPLTSPWPVRIEFFGDEIESMRYFDPLSQISREEVQAVVIPPGGELGLLKRQSKIQNPKSKIQDEGYTAQGTLLDYLRRDAVIVVCEPDRVDERAQEYERQVPDGDQFFLSWADFREMATRRGLLLLELNEAAEVFRLEDEPEREVPDGSAAVLSRSTLGEADAFETFQGLNPSPPAAAQDSRAPVQPELFLQLQNLEAFRPLAQKALEPLIAETERREFFNQLHRWLRQNYAVHVFCNNDGEKQRFSEVWEEYGLGKEVFPKVQIGDLSRGFLSDEGAFTIVTDAEIFGRYKVQRPRRLKSPHAQAAKSALDIDFTELEESDYVVHLQHGIGRYLGLHVLPVGSGTKPTETALASAAPGQECLVIEYAPSDPAQPPPKLYVPVTEAHLVSKYVGTGKARPPLNTLGGTRWAKAKEHAERAVRDVASDLLAIQAARESQAGHAFSSDTPWQREFEGSFVYEETPDQMKAIVEAKKDMERPKPMDRLVCGDVGFGKTEVGIRAAFKAVMGGKQVAVLVPTTVLAQQHYNTFRERMADYPVRIELLSRFRTRREQQRVVAELAGGAVDIVIGTHRLLQNDIAFKDLGLVVIDEEQRFGVMHKEKFKMLRKLVDVLTLSATPIPRTLYLALTGARDMSTIQTPPHDRLPVETIVTAYDERVIRDSIQRELNRGGQVFFLHNRVMTIQTMAQKLQNLVPQARIVVGHGQMDSDDLEEVMTSFVNGQADVLLSTTIIESGLDIPNANTIIIDRADRFGLSDLYQLRGRVGRYKHQAYAYLLLPRHGNLVADVRKRITAIKQYSTLGSGFKIAMRDLEIRGAGNLLGAEQSGHITAVGFELYCQLLKQSVSALKGEKVKPRLEVQIRLDFLPIGADDRSRRREEADKIPKSRVQSPKSVDVARDSERPPDTQHATRNTGSSLVTRHASPASESAFIPFSYISDARQRIEIYRKLAQAGDKPSIQALEKELRDRFGPVPKPLQLLLQLAELRILAAEKAVTIIEVKEDRLMLTRNNDYVMIGSKFPRLTKTTASARFTEIKKLLLAL